MSLQNPRPGDKQGGTALDLFLWHQAQPALHLHPLLLLEGPQKLRFHQLRRPRCISRHKRVLDRLLDQSLAGIPRARSPVQRGQLLCADTRLQALLQQALEQGMKAIPSLVLVEGDKEHVRALYPVQGRLHLSR